MEHILSRRGQRRDGAAVEAVLQRDDRDILLAKRLRGIFARGLDGTLVRFRARV